MSGSVCWGHDTGVVEDNIRDFLNNWSGDAVIAGIGDNEQLVFDSGEYMESETWYAGAGRVRLLTNKYIYVLNFDAQTGLFTAGNTIIGATSGATATIVGVYQSGGIGSLYLTNIVGTFQNNEIIYESALGGELVTDGDCSSDSFGKDAGWTYDAGNQEYDCDGVAAGQVNIYQDLSLTSGYFLTSYTVKNYVAGNSIFYVGNLGQGTGQAGNGTYSEAIIHSGNAYIYVGGYNNFDGSVDDISVKQITNAALANGTIAAFSEGTPVVKYKQGSSQALCEADSWHAYTIPFVCGGWVKIRLECT